MTKLNARQEEMLAKFVELLNNNDMHDTFVSHMTKFGHSGNKTLHSLFSTLNESQFSEVLTEFDWADCPDYNHDEPILWQMHQDWQEIIK